MKSFWKKLKTFTAKLWHIGLFRKMFFGFVGLMALALIMDQIIMPAYTKHGKAVPVPDVTRIRYENARDILESRGFKIVKMEERFDSQYPHGYVIEQTPRAGSQVKEGRRIYVILSKGPRRFPVPKLVGISERNAKLLLSKFGLVLGERSYEYSVINPSGVVMRQSISPGVEVPMGTKIDIVISLGSVPDQFMVPSVVGRTLDDAREIIQRAGFKIGRIRYEAVKELLPETVIKQSIKPGTTFSQEEKDHLAIDLVVSMLPENEGLH
ncbi:MAG: PASTA domain-containing protein [candidate division KSB1 bacterium]|nr:PASTA domain-containing protein [candidate division KSB1 bacterium]MDQ7064986.1 PASTA domain-containing protein [candidate division KSB1 bacterium]